ncbi:MAG: type II secretion system protein N [Pseudomonadota bacterium]
MKRMPILFSLLALIALSVSAAYWTLQLYTPQQRPLAALATPAPPEPSMAAAGTLFGGQAVAATAASYQLTGVVADGADSVAILVPEGAPPRALKVGKEIAAGVTVAEVHPRYVMLSEGGVLKRVELATDARAASATAAPLPPGAQPGTVQPGPPPQMPAPTRVTVPGETPSQ